jgi:putative sterol carrier protein
VAANWQEIMSMEGPKEYPNANAALMDMLMGSVPQTPGGRQPAAVVRPPEAAAAPPVGTVAASQPMAVASQPSQAGSGNPVQAAFDRLPSTFQSGAAAGLNVVFQFRLAGPKGGDWHVVVKDGACAVAAGVHAAPTTTLKMSDDDFLSLIGGKLSAMSAYTSGKLKIEGDLMKSQLVQKLFKF